MTRFRLKGFSLIELLVALAILSVISALSVGQIRGAQKRNRDYKRKSDLNLIAQALDAYYAEQRTYPGQAEAPPCPEYRSTSGDSWLPGIQTYMPSSQGGAAKVPRDPQNNATYYYTYQCITNGTGSYSLWVPLENKKDPESERDSFGNPVGLYRIDR